ncbi:DUF6695 family protein [Aquiflexum sp.]|uniref:DUF6695 family protein n=1 Tax=Aquiflexum sp. TaxID=1872584 RepID=UPI0035939318
MERNRERPKDLAIVLAWPQTWCKQPGSWYDNLMAYFGVSKNHYYAVGHAAVVLIEGKTGRCHYYDFGRYHAPYQYGRVRGELTDPELVIKQQALYDEFGDITNVKEILKMLSKREACHGQGKLFASICQINFKKANQKALEMQESSPLPYGPFAIKGSNCSRFVNDVVKAGEPYIGIYLKLQFPKSITPTPMGNVKSSGNVIMVGNDDLPPPPKCRLLNQVLEAPKRHAAIPNTAKWLSGEGAGSWYDIKQIGTFFYCRRFDEKGRIEFSSFYELEGKELIHLDSGFSFGYPSHFQRITLIQKNKIFVLKNIGPFGDDLFQKAQSKIYPKIDIDFIQKMSISSN